jgi:hypothetical protein
MKSTSLQTRGTLATKIVPGIQSAACGFSAAHSGGRLEQSLLLSGKFSKQLCIKLVLCGAEFVYRRLYGETGIGPTGCIKKFILPTA